MRIPDFQLERFFARYEFSVPYLLCASDVEGWPMAEVLALADDERPRPVGRPEARLHRVDGASAAPRGDRAALFDASTGGRCPRLRGRRGGDLRLRQRPARAGRPRRRGLAGYQSLHEVARSPGADVTLTSCTRRTGWVLDLGSLSSGRHAAHEAHRGQHPAQPDRHAPDRADVRRAGRHRGRRRRHAPLRRGLSRASRSTLPTGLPAGADLADTASRSA